MSEEEIVDFEVARNEAWDEYADARPNENFTQRDIKLFEAGFRKAWESLDA